MSKYFEIEGYWKDDKETFSGYIVKEFDDVDDKDDLIFFYGLSEADLITAIDREENTNHEFVVTSYRETELC